MDPVLKQLEERRENASRLIRRGNSIVERGKAELAECDRFEQFYRAAMASANPAQAALEKLNAPTLVERAYASLESPAEKAIRLIDQSSPATHALDQMERQSTLKKTIKAILAKHPTGLLSGELLKAIRLSGYPDLLRTSMSPQLSRMSGKEVVNVGGRWTLTENKEAASLL